MNRLPIITGEFTIVFEPELFFLPSGKAKLKIRGLAKDTQPDPAGKWVDKSTLFIDIVVWEQAENLAESVAKGDNIVVIGRLKSYESTDKEGNKRTNIEIEATDIGPSMRWNPAKTPKAGGAAATPSAVKDLPDQEESSPF